MKKSDILFWLAYFLGCICHYIMARVMNDMLIYYVFLWSFCVGAIAGFMRCSLEVLHDSM